MMTYLSGGGFSIFDLRFSIGSSDWSPPQQIENQQSKIKNLPKHEVISPRPLSIDACHAKTTIHPHAA